MPINLSTTSYLTGTVDVVTDVYGNIRSHAAIVVADLVALRSALATRTGLKFAMSMDATTPGVVQALQYEATDKLKTLDRNVLDCEEMLRRLITALADDEAMTARMQAAADAVDDEP